MWKTKSSQELYKTRFFRLRVDECELSDGRLMPRYYVLEFPDWVNVIALTGTRQVVMLKQYRHGAGQVFWEIPGGSTYPGKHEDPQLAAARELLEETGYQSERWVKVGEHFPNPALQNNRLHTYLAFDCQKVAEPTLDPFEELETVVLPYVEVTELMTSGQIQHSLILASMSLAWAYLNSHGHDG